MKYSNTTMTSLGDLLKMSLFFQVLTTTGNSFRPLMAFIGLNLYERGVAMYPSWLSSLKTSFSSSIDSDDRKPSAVIECERGSPPPTKGGNAPLFMTRMDAIIHYVACSPATKRLLSIANHDLQPVFDVIGEVMARGPKKTPTAILKMRGAWRAKTRTGEPQPNTTQLDSPEFLGPREKIIFDQMSEALYRVGVLTEIDGSSLSRYAICLVRWIDAEAALSAGTPTHIEIIGDDERPKGYKETPPYMVSCKMHDQLLKLECQFGLTPASRPNLQSSNGGKDGIIDIMRAIQ
jgi:phage terminase small subunit